MGLSGAGTYLFDLKNDIKAESKSVCRIHSDFIASFVNNLVRQQISLNKASAVEPRFHFQKVIEV